MEIKRLLTEHSANVIGLRLGLFQMEILDSRFIRESLNPILCSLVIYQTKIYHAVLEYDKRARKMFRH
jgi:hypothetical protein